MPNKCDESSGTFQPQRRPLFSVRNTHKSLSLNSARNHRVRDLTAGACTVRVAGIVNNITSGMVSQHLDCVSFISKKVHPVLVRVFAWAVQCEALGLPGAR